MHRLACGCCLVVGLVCGFAPRAFGLRGPRVESAAVTPPGKVAAEFGHRFERDATGAHQNTQQFTISSGLASAQQIDLIVPWRVHHSTAENAAFGDLALMHKIGSITALGDGSVLLGNFSQITFPTSSASRMGGQNYQFSTNMLLTKATQRQTATLNLGSVVQSHGTELMRYGAGFEYVWPRAGLYGELFGLTDLQDNGANEVLSGRGGVEMLIGKRFAVDIGGEIGLTRSAPDWGALGGATCTF